MDEDTADARSAMAAASTTQRRPGRWRRPSQALVVALCVLGGLAACGRPAGGSQDTHGPHVTVLAASSLHRAFGELKTVYENEHPGTRVRLSFGSSSAIVDAVVRGDPADVLATHDEQAMKTVTHKHLTNGSPKTFATDPLVLITPPRDPGHVSSMADLDRRGVTFAVCVPEAPCGAASTKLLALHHVRAGPTTQKPTVKGVLTTVARGKVDAGLVYASGAHAAESTVRTVKTAPASEGVQTCPIAVLASSADPSAAAEWVDLVRSPHGQSILESDGFGPSDAE